MPFFWSMQFFFNHVTHVTRTKISIQATYVTYTKTLWSHAINATHTKTWHMPPKLLTRLTNRDYPHHPRYLADSIKNNSNNKNLHYVFMIFLLIIQIFFTARQCHPSPIGITKKMICFSRFEFCFETKAGYFSIKNIKRNC